MVMPSKLSRVIFSKSVNYEYKIITELTFDGPEPNFELIEEYGDDLLYKSEEVVEEETVKT